MKENRLKLEEFCYADLRDRLIEHGENAFIYYIERQYYNYERDINGL
tara:strand:- start:1124 stop:1264 length:141 start_codon:yes stop_codon:yes gene_type:complete